MSSQVEKLGSLWEFLIDLVYGFASVSWAIAEELFEWLGRTVRKTRRL